MSDAETAQPEQHPSHRPIFSFSRRSGRLTEGQLNSWNTLGPKYLVDVERAELDFSVSPSFRVDPAELFGRDAPLVVEVGSGTGEAVVAAAAEHPEWNFLAVEVFVAGLARTLRRIEDAGLSNVRLVEANAVEVLEHMLPAGSIEELWIFFPDPWHKAKHTKRRLVREGFGAVAANALRPGGRMRLATDWEDYAFQMREVLDAAPEFTSEHPGEWAPRFDGRTLTVFERKAATAGRRIHDLSYVTSE
ncbi:MULTISPECIES: tRNA (guanosine(46)-N7)-methyltransferase TrmB [unclassified Pseudoclavibacter]|uniref:tRNA (guanosine(46)-N7)-methyltransferase TrmB n=1 Tax=unclassified Pseudoclavibacter TaxID=2615177 RepID=UPI001BA5861C|nr:tRNA (guanosine(46)-N7)-methyltransferase TrmB [Pseudoclavibacter sp. Marseille-Q4354]MBS3179222.1 tRNA (guanosine(46)-N7)-methyltransferase TrmB [Pseudoclavibacter sp. Marseille-Q4354]